MIIDINTIDNQAGIVVTSLFWNRIGHSYFKKYNKQCKLNHWTWTRGYRFLGTVKFTKHIFLTLALLIYSDNRQKLCVGTMIFGIESSTRCSFRIRQRQKIGKISCYCKNLKKWKISGKKYKRFEIKEGHKMHEALKKIHVGKFLYSIFSFNFSYFPHKRIANDYSLEIFE